jgi:hypothetical protein
MVPGRPYSVVAALEPGRTSWTGVLDAVRLGPHDDETDVTAAQVRDVVTRLAGAGHRTQGDPDILVVFDAGYDIARLTHLLADVPVQLVGRLRSDRVLYFPPPPRRAGRGRPSRHGTELKLAGETSRPAPAVTTITQTTRYGTAVAQAWDRLHPRLTHRAAWAGHSDGELPILEGTLIRLQAGHLPGDRNPKPVWLWWSRTRAHPGDVDRCWQAFLRRFDLEHTFLLQESSACRMMLRLRALRRAFATHLVGVVLVVVAGQKPGQRGPATCTTTSRGDGGWMTRPLPARSVRTPVCTGLDPRRRIRLFKQVLGWTAPKIRDPGAADRWTWLVIACHAQLRLTRDLAADLRRPWERPAPPGRLTLARVSRGFRNIRATSARPAGAPKPGKPGPGRPPGSKNRRPAARHDVGKNPSKPTPSVSGTKETG